MAADYICNLIVPGAAKSGTSALHDYLDRHPLIEMSSRKEPHHFCRDDHYAGGAEAHNSLFSHDGPAVIRGESSTGYLPWQPAIERIVRDLRNPRIIMILRDPVGRTFSHYRWRVRLGLEKRPFLHALREDGYGFRPDRPDRFGHMAYIQFSQYASQCPEWINAFGEQNCLVLSSRQLRDDPAATLDRCYKFLGLPVIPFEGSLQENETNQLGRLPTGATTRLASLLPGWIRRSSFYRFVRRRALVAMAPTPVAQMTAEERAFLEDMLAEDIAWFRARFDAESGP